MQLKCSPLPCDVMCTDTYRYIHSQLSTLLFPCHSDIMQASHWYILTTPCYKDDVIVITQGVEVECSNSDVT